MEINVSRKQCLMGNMANIKLCDVSHHDNIERSMNTLTCTMLKQTELHVVNPPDHYIWYFLFSNICNMTAESKSEKSLNVIFVHFKQKKHYLLKNI